MAQARPNNLSKARATLIAQREKIVGGLANKYSSKAVTDFVAVSDGIELIDELIRREGQKPA